MRKKLIIFLQVILAAALSFTVLVASAASVREMELPHYDQLSDKAYNANLFYRNDLTNKAADPSVIYVNHGRDAGYFYAYATSDQIGATGYQSWRSKDLAYWEPMGVAFVPERNSWGIQNYWAPEVIYYESSSDSAGEGKYYLFYNAWDDNHPDRYHSLGMAISDNPWGPFIQYTGTQYSGGNSFAGGTAITGTERVVNINTPWLDRSAFPSSLGSLSEGYLKDGAYIDASPFIDPESGNFYLYFVLDIQTKGVTRSSIWGIQLSDRLEPMYETATQITRVGQTKVNGGVAINETTGNNTNEGPCMLYKDGKYYMTFSVSQYYNATYSAAQAIGKSPLDADFEKVSRANGGRFLTSTGLKSNGTDDPSYSYYPGFMAGTGHHSFAYVGDEIYVIYHAFVERSSIAEGRALAADKVEFVTNSEGVQVIYVNGPSFALQPLPQALSGYINLAKSAQVTATNAVEGNGAGFLNDGLYMNHSYSFIKNFHANKSTVITLSWTKEVNVNAIMVYQGFDDYDRFDSVDRISIETTATVAGLKFKGNAVINNLKFDTKNIFVDVNNPQDRYMMPGGACIAEFNPLKTKSITITVTGVNDLLAIGEIVILGKEVA